MALLTDQILASGVTSSDLIHIVITGNTSQNPAGSSFKASVAQVATAIGSPGFSGGTVPYNTYFSNSLSANTFSATTYLNLPGSSSGGCLSDFYVQNIHSCSPLYINPLNEGPIIFGQSSQVYMNLTNKYVGFNNPNPIYNIDAFGSSGGRFFFRGATSPAVQLSGGSTVISSKQIAAGLNGIEISVIGDTFPSTYAGLISGDTLIGTTSSANNLAIATLPGASLQKNIKFFAGKTPDNKPDLVIVGTGSTRGYVGVNMLNPSVEFHVDGNSKINNGLTASTLNISSTPSTDTDLSSYYLTRDSSTGQVKLKQVPGPTIYGLYSQTGNCATVSGTTSETTIIGPGNGTLQVPANGFSVGDSFSLKMFGDIGCANTDTLTIKIKSGSVILANTGAINMPSVTNSHFNLDVSFTIRSIGAAGVASIVSSGFFTFTSNASGTLEAASFSTINDTTFDTTGTNTLDITAQFSSTNVSNFIFSEILNLNKVY